MLTPGRTHMIITDVIHSKNWQKRTHCAIKFVIQVSNKLFWGIKSAVQFMLLHCIRYYFVPLCFMTFVTAVLFSSHTAELHANSTTLCQGRPSLRICHITVDSSFLEIVLSTWSTLSVYGPANHALVSASAKWPFVVHHTDWGQMRSGYRDCSKSQYK